MNGRLRCGEVEGHACPEPAEGLRRGRADVRFSSPSCRRAALTELRPPRGRFIGPTDQRCAGPRLGVSG
jgi:hypothetical protein